MRVAKIVWIKYVQLLLRKSLEDSVTVAGGKKKINGPFKKMSPNQDKFVVCRIGSRLKEFTPFTEYHKPAMLLPRDSRYTELLMVKAHNKGHVCVVGTVATFRMAGFWTTQAGRLAKKVRTSCVFCQYLDHQPINQKIGTFPKQSFVNPLAWGDVELDFMGPYICRSDVIEDVNSGAVYCDVMLDYSTEAVILMLKKFSAVNDWPSWMTSDPGSQLESAAGILTLWWTDWKGSLLSLARRQSFSWEISPADSPWRQGKVERRIRVIKMLIRVAVGESKLSLLEMQTVIFEAANLLNERPLGVSKKVQADETYLILMPNCLLMRRATNRPISDVFMESKLTKSQRFKLV